MSAPAFSESNLIASIEQAWDRDAPSGPTRSAIAAVLDRLETGSLRVAEKRGGAWAVNEWVKKAILLHFRFTPSERILGGDLAWDDKVTPRTDLGASGVRAVPPAVVRRGAHVEAGVVLMPCFVNIGAWIGAETMIDTWSTVGSCAQIGRRCHISGGVGIGGVLEPVQARPVIIEDDVFIGARSEVAEGVLVEEGAVLAMGCFVGATTKIFDAESGETITGRIPSRAVCVPGTLPSRDGSHATYAVIIKKRRDARTDARTALNEILRG
jgi:2,3,4,5-tetrahydropyridine-2-carboxylate N-succinyltransferase